VYLPLATIECAYWHGLRTTRATRRATIKVMGEVMSTVDMQSTCIKVHRMSKMIQIRNVPEEVHRILKVRAAAEGISLSDYIKRDLEDMAMQATIEEIGERGRRRGSPAIRTESILADLRQVRED
jgi:antitoxin FitA